MFTELLTGHDHLCLHRDHHSDDRFACRHLQRQIRSLLSSGVDVINLYRRRHDIQQNNTQHNDTQQFVTYSKNEIKHNSPMLLR
jgi:hypothetical protein